MRIGKINSANLALVGSLLAIYALSQFFRNSVGVIGPELAREFNLDARSLGLLGAIFYFSFALTQIPVGMAIDRFGAKETIVTTALAAIAGAVIFAQAANFTVLAAGRLIIGMGCSSFYMGTLTIYARRFPPDRFAMMAGIQLGAGTLGSLMATAPLVAASAWIGWRATFMGIAALCAVTTLIVAVLVREDDALRIERQKRRENLRDLLAGVAVAARVPSFWPVFLIQATTYSAFASIVGLWGSPWLTQVYGVNGEVSGRILFVTVLAQVSGLFAWGWADRFFGGYRVAGLTGVGGGVILLAILASAQPPLAWVPPLLALFALFLAVTPVLTAHGRALFPPELVGRGLTLLNVGNMGGVFVQQMLTGFVIESFGARVVDGVRIYPAAGYRAVFAVLGCELALAALLYWRCKDTHPSKKQ